MLAVFRALRMIRALVALQLIGTFLGFATTLIFSVDDLHLPGTISLSGDGDKISAAIVSLAAVNFAVPLLFRLLHLPVRWLSLMALTTVLNAFFFQAIGRWTGGYTIQGRLPELLSPALMGIVTGTFAWLTAGAMNSRDGTASGSRH